MSEGPLEGNCGVPSQTFPSDGENHGSVHESTKHPYRYDLLLDGVYRHLRNVLMDKHLCIHS